MISQGYADNCLAYLWHMTAGPNHEDKEVLLSPGGVWKVNDKSTRESHLNGEIGGDH